MSVITNVGDSMTDRYDNCRSANCTYDELRVQWHAHARLSDYCFIGCDRLIGLLLQVYQSDEIVVAEDATQPEPVLEQIQTSANESENFVEEQAPATEEQASPIEEQVSAIEQPVEIPLETKLASSAEPVAERAETIVQEQPAQPVAQMSTSQVAPESVTRIIKSNPNESKRSRAEQQYREFAEDGTSPLTSNEYQQV